MMAGMTASLQTSVDSLSRNMKQTQVLMQQLPGCLSRMLCAVYRPYSKVHVRHCLLWAFPLTGPYQQVGFVRMHG